MDKVSFMALLESAHLLEASPQPREAALGTSIREVGTFQASLTWYQFRQPFAGVLIS